MDLTRFLASLGDKKETLVKKAFLCKNAEELLALAKENGAALDQTGAEELFAAIQIKGGKLSDDELDSVAGGANKANNVRCGACGNEFYLVFGTRPAPPLYLTPRCPQCNSTNLSMI